MKIIELGKEGLEYLQSVLKGGDLLAQALLQTVRLEEGAMVTFLPDNADVSQLSFKDGGLGKIEYDDDLKAPLVMLLSDFVKKSPANSAFIEATSVPPEKLSLWSATTPSGFHYVTAEKTTRRARNPETQEQIPMIGVYGVLTATYSDPAYVSEFLDEAFPFRKIGILTSAPEGYLPQASETVTSEWLESVADRTRCIFAGAFDGSGWIVWFYPDVAALLESAPVSESPN